MSRERSDSDSVFSLLLAPQRTEEKDWRIPNPRLNRILMLPLSSVAFAPFSNDTLCAFIY